MFTITVLISGNGTNLQALIDGIQSGLLVEVQINAVISNRKDAYGLTRAVSAGITALECSRSKSSQSRQEYEQELLQTILQLKPRTDLIVCAGWMHVLGSQFLSHLAKTKIKIINLHPALPGQYPGKDAIGQAFLAYQSDRSVRSGCMIHYVVPEIDAGETIESCEVPIYPADTLETLTRRVQYFEKPTLLKAVMRMITDTKTDQKMYLRSGKVRDIYDLGFGLMALVNTDRFSSFDRHICQVPYKGLVLNQTSRWWFKQTEHIMANHLVDYVPDRPEVMIVEKCQVIPVEVVLRAYITGSTSTSLWTNYQQQLTDSVDKEVTYCGLKFPRGLKKNQRLDQVVITPTTKDDEHDQPISAEQVIEMGLCSRSEWDLISYKALELFKFAAETAEQVGLILVDTKLEFGRDLRTGEIMLIDEIFTSDSSRWWLLDTYQERFEQGMMPDNLDKDLIREYVKERCDPYQSENLPKIPESLIEEVSRKYLEFYKRLTGQDLM